MPISKKSKKTTNKKRTRKRIVKKQKGGIKLSNPLKQKQNPSTPSVSTNVSPPLTTTSELIASAPNVSETVMPNVSEENIQANNMEKNINDNTKDNKNEVNDDTEKKQEVNDDTDSEDDDTDSEDDDNDSEDDDSDSDSEDEDDEVDESMKIIEQFLESDCNNVMLKDLMFIAKDINKILLEILPLFDEELVDIIIIFLANFNTKFAEDEDFRNQLNIAIENVINTIVNSGMDAIGSGCSIIVKILTQMVQAIPGAGAVISSLMIANNIADTGELISNSGKNISKASNDFTGKISELMGKISDTMPKIDNSKFNFKDVLEKKRQEARMLKDKKEKKKKNKENKENKNISDLNQQENPSPNQIQSQQ